MRKLQWASARVVFVTMALAAVSTGGLLAFILGPLYTWYFFNDIKCFKFYRYFYPIISCGGEMVVAWFREPAYRKMFAIPLTAPPMMAPDLSLARVRADWPKDTGGCNGCAQCCAQRACPLLDPETNRCRSYGSFYWLYFNCGRYPETTDQIKYYRCDKWEIPDAQET